MISLENMENKNISKERLIQSFSFMQKSQQISELRKIAKVLSGSNHDYQLILLKLLDEIEGL